MIIGVLRWGWVEVILRVSLEVILHHTDERITGPVSEVVRLVSATPWENKKPRASRP